MRNRRRCCGGGRRGSRIYRRRELDAGAESERTAERGASAQGGGVCAAVGDSGAGGWRERIVDRVSEWVVRRSWLRMLRRRSQRTRWTWTRFMERLGVLLPAIEFQYPYPTARFDAKHPRQEPCA